MSQMQIDWNFAIRLHLHWIPSLEEEHIFFLALISKAPESHSSQRLPLYPGLQKDTLPDPQDFSDFVPHPGFVPCVLQASPR